ncbi:MAG: MBL fold metallo-hydrolase, partial [Acidimicrobiales bacterium]
MSPGPKGEIAESGLIEHSKRFVPKRWTVAETVHCLVGWGLANCTVIEAPDGLVVIDTGESVEEARDHIAQIRSFTDAPVAAIVYSHFHYVSGTSAWLAESNDGTVPILAHHRLPGNVAGSTAETGPSWIRRALTQFGVYLPHDGPDAMPNMGIGPFMFNPEHTSRTAGYEPPTGLATEFPAQVDVGGIDAVLYSAPSDADDSLVIATGTDAAHRQAQQPGADEQEYGCRQVTGLRTAVRSSQCREAGQRAGVAAGDGDALGRARDARVAG